MMPRTRQEERERIARAAVGGSFRDDMEAEMAVFREAPADDHPYGAWSGGSKSAGGSKVHGGSASDVAKKLRAEAEEAEPRITKALTDVAAETGGTMEGLNHKLKEQDSLVRKIKGDMEPGVASKNGLSPGMAGAGINDHLRYTMVSGSPEQYTKQYVNARDKLAKQGYKPMKDPKNFWTDVPPPPLYQGVNAVFVGPKGQRFELQFHTKASLAAKGKTHGLFKIFGAPGASAAVKAKQWKLMQDIQAPLRAPAGWPPDSPFRHVAGKDFAP